MKIIDFGIVPQALNDKDQLISFKKGKFYLLDAGKNYEVVYSIEMPFYQHKLLSRFRVIERILRNTPGPCIQIDDHNYIYHYKSCVYLINLLENKISLELSLPTTKKILNFSICKCPETDCVCVFFGEYFENKNKSEVNIWRRAKNGHWSVYSTFPSNSIEHIHNIVEDQFRKQLIILTGDFGEGSGIWTLNRENQAPKKILAGSQMYRATWIFIDKSRLIYATDTPFEKNYLIEIDLRESGIRQRKLHLINGSSIYGGVVKNRVIYFSTSVEPIELTGNRWSDIFQRKKGVGIIDNKSYVYKYKIDTDELDVVMSDPKDAIPMRLGQYGSFQLSSSYANNNKILIYGLALKKYDNFLIEIEV